MVDSHKRANVTDRDKKLRSSVKIINILLLSNKKNINITTWTRDSIIMFEQLSSAEILSRPETRRSVRTSALEMNIALFSGYVLQSLMISMFSMICCVKYCHILSSSTSILNGRHDA